MCKPGNQSIYRECREAIYRQLDSHAVISNAQMHRIIAEHGGCMTGEVDTKRKAVLVSTK